MSRPVDPEETATLAVLAELGRAPGAENTRVISAEDEVEEVLRRLNLEALGLLAWGLEAEAPNPEIRQKLLSRLGDDTQEVAPVREPVGSSETANAAAAPAESDQRAAAPADAEVRPAAPIVAFPQGGAAARRRSPWPKLLAAVFALAAAGLGFWAAWLSSELGSSRARIARIEGELARIEREHVVERTALASSLAAAESRFQLATAPGATLFALRPAAGSRQPLAKGALMVAADHQHWQLEIHGLEPEPADRDYQLWFMVDGLPLSGGVFEGRHDGAATLADARMPAGTTAVAVTLERRGGVPAPTTPILLAGDRPVTL